VAPCIPDDLDKLLSQAHAQDALDAEIRAAGVHPNPLLPAAPPSDAVFVSDWNGNHPFLSEFIGDFIGRRIESFGGLTRYSHLEEDPDLAAGIRALHAGRYDEPIGEVGFLPGTGSASFLATMLFRARQAGFDRLCYLPPVYNSAIHLIQQMGFGVRKVADDVDFVADVRLHLPDERSALWLTDPVWFAGRPVRRSTMDQIADWQRRTGSLVLVDGTFQYLQWESRRRERASVLDPALTYRLVCPTKALAVHGFRFAYLIVPQADLAAVTHLHSCLHGAAGVVDRAFAHAALRALGSSAGNLPLVHFARDRYQALCDSGALAEWVTPESGFFVFARPAVSSGSLYGMGPDCFETRGLPGYLRINLLSDAAITWLTGRRAGEPATAAAGGR
jgi:aspartate/methionine/tyrosine aminotransferase